MNEAIVVVIRSLIGFFTLLFFARLLGKQQLSQLTFFDYVLGITIGSIAASLSVDLTSRAWPHWIGLLTWTGTVLGLQWCTILWKGADRSLAGEPSIVIINGRIMEENMKKSRYTLSDLLEQLRDKQVFNLSQVDFAVLETNGQLSVLLKPEHQFVTRKDLNLTPSPAGLGNELVYSGVLIEENLKKAGVDRLWLNQQLQLQGISSPAEVFLASYDPESGELYVDKYVDQ